jgi:hypothetical protein
MCSLSLESKNGYTLIRCLSTIRYMTNTRISFRELPWIYIVLQLTQNRLYWTTEDVLSYLASTLEDPHFLKLKALRDRHSLNSTESEANDEGRIPSSTQHAKSARRGTTQFEGLRKDVAGGHRVQDIKELMKVEVIVVSDITKSPPVLVVYASESP